MKSGLTEEDCENLTIELIRILQKWGLWTDVTIFTNGNRYKHSYEKKDIYNGLPYLSFSENINPEDYTTGYVEIFACNGKRSYIEKCFDNPEHIFEMVFEGPLYALLNYEEYVVDIEEISDEAWEDIFSKTDILEEYIADRYGVYEKEELANLSDPDFPVWDPLVFDTWEEYQRFVYGISDEEKVKCTPNSKRDDGSYDEWLNEQNAIESEFDHRWEALEGSFEVQWENLKCKAKKELVSDYFYESVLRSEFNVFAGNIISEINEIFSKYGLWYEQTFEWGLTSYKEGDFGK